jgi:uncharacterized membrane protein
MGQQMSTVETGVLWVHIAAGFLALFAGLGAFLTRKGGRRHRRSGRVFVGSMAVVSGSALALYPFEPSFLRLFLSLVAVFSFYFAFSGYRTLSRKRPASSAAPVDWLAVGLYGLVSAGLVVLGVGRLLGGSDFAAVLLVFGGLGLLFTIVDIRSFRRERAPTDWIGEHVVRMGGGYIAAVSAFSAVNFGFLPAVPRWLWPTLLGTPALVYLRRRYEARFGAAT